MIKVCDGDDADDDGAEDMSEYVDHGALQPRAFSFLWAIRKYYDFRFPVQRFNIGWILVLSCVRVVHDPGSLE